MFKKFSSGILIIILAILVVIYLIIRYTGSNDRTFKDKLLSFDSGDVTQIIIENPKEHKEPVELTFTGNKWTVKENGNDYTADTNMVKNILKQLDDLKTKRYAGRGSDTWIKYQVTDTSAITVTLKSSGNTIGEVYIGKFDYTQPKEQPQQMQYGRQRGDMTSYVRLKGDKDVYAVDGFLRMGFNSTPSAYRYKSLVQVNPTDINRITITEPGNTQVIEDQNGKWLLNGTPADSTKTVRFRSSISRVSGTKFIDEAVQPASPSYSMTIEGNNFTPVELNAYPSADTNIVFIVTSSANPGAYFNGKEGGLFKKIWQSY